MLQTPFEIGRKQFSIGTVALFLVCGLQQSSQ
jgi:hypothetical protein